MILPFRFLWKQFRGPQITAVTQAIYEYIKDMFDHILDYFNTFSLDTCTDEHLTILGVIGQICRPTIVIDTIKNFFFTDGVMHGSQYGFSELTNLNIGGRLVDLNELNSASAAVRLPEEYFRDLLRCILNSDGELGGLVLLKDVLTYMYQRFRPLDNIDFQIQYGTFNDIIIYVGDEQYWPLNDIVLINITIQILLNSGYLPNYQIILKWEDPEN